MARKTNNVKPAQSFVQLMTGPSHDRQLFRRREWRSAKGNHLFVEITVTRSHERLRMGVISHGREVTEIDRGQCFLELGS